MLSLEVNRQARSIFLSPDLEPGLERASGLDESPEFDDERGDDATEDQHRDHDNQEVDQLLPLGFAGGLRRLAGDPLVPRPVDGRTTAVVQAQRPLEAILLVSWR